MLQRTNVIIIIFRKVFSFLSSPLGRRNILPIEPSGQERSHGHHRGGVCDEKVVEQPLIMFQKGAIHISQSTVMGEGESAILSQNFSGKRGEGQTTKRRIKS